ncbi:sialidase-1 [Murinocardiopsis flavida]|uniref:exo-alpha-sialidase n=1 Tax=Murinocardiopsis flavida TaxID=645275 RepID=A0A2P8DP82_9ACTN|nr:sialidase family protein [Murinocardiopsis flavida]PSK99028.1 sialidase-1 [Murinocardiopsis flavida]
MSRVRAARLLGSAAVLAVSVAAAAATAVPPAAADTAAVIGADNGTGGGGERGPAPAAATVFAAGGEGYASFRIPAVVAAANGDLLAFAEGRKGGPSDTGDIDLVLKRSADKGRTWGPLTVVGDNGANTFGNPVPVVVPRTGRVVLLSTHNAGTVDEDQILRGEASAEETRRVWVQHSDDNGGTWSAPRDITGDAKRGDWRWYATGPVHGIALRSGPHAGRLVVPANHSAAPAPGSGDQGDEAKYYGAHLLYSDDAGASWHIGAVDDSYEGEVNTNESTVAELPDGRLHVNHRDQNGTAAGTRAVSLSTDGGESFASPPTMAPDLVGPVVQGSVLQPRGGPLLFSGPGRADARADLVLRASSDNGESWADAHAAPPGPAGYSDLVALGGRSVGVLYETGESGLYERIAFLPVPLRR